ncbi:MAG: M67 family metallopeptidase [Polyangia bacterium]|jgi:proteasome lid subunit RPN8/RPN11
MSGAIVRLSADVEAEIRTQCERAYPLEACGAILGRGDGESESWSVLAIRPAPNRHGDDQRRRYLVPPEFQVAAERDARLRGQDVIGYFHSHPDHPAQPSEYDRLHAWVGYLYAICAVAQGRATDMNAFALEEGGGAFQPVRIEKVTDSSPLPSEVI